MPSANTTLAILPQPHAVGNSLHVILGHSCTHKENAGWLARYKNFLQPIQLPSAGANVQRAALNSVILSLYIPLLNLRSSSCSQPPFPVGLGRGTFFQKGGPILAPLAIKAVEAAGLSEDGLEEVVISIFLGEEVAAFPNFQRTRIVIQEPAVFQISRVSHPIFKKPICDRKVQRRLALVSSRAVSTIDQAGEGQRNRIHISEREADARSNEFGGGQNSDAQEFHMRITPAHFRILELISQEWPSGPEREQAGHSEQEEFFPAVHAGSGKRRQRTRQATCHGI